MVLPCIPANDTANRIAQSCEDSWSAHNNDCNHFVKAAVGRFLETGYFDGLNADGIVEKLKTASDAWKRTTAIDDAIAAAKDGNIVIAGMSSIELNDTDGHLAVVIGCDGEQSGSVNVPMGYAGSLRTSARLAGGRLSSTFNAELVRSERLNYFITAPEVA